LVYWFTGGLNFQVEHHLFPKVSHIHYYKISQIVRDLCKKYNVTYNEYPTFLDAFKSHIAHLKVVGNAA
jgi:linoleoyl-CoA desaturase